MMAKELSYAVRNSTEIRASNRPKTEKHSAVCSALPPSPGILTQVLFANRICAPDTILETLYGRPCR